VLAVSGGGLNETGKPLDRLVQVKLPSDLYDELVEWAREGDRTVNQEVRRALRKYLAGDLDA